MRKTTVHEVSVALAMADELMKIAEEHRATKISRVKLKVGALSGIVTDSLIFAFDAIKLEHPLLTSASVEIEEVPTVYRCNACGSSFQADDPYFPSCSHCSSIDLELVSGEEQHIDQVEVEV
jgi:hydrogenase nickel incorporation protein HypA/HybF